MYSFIFIHSLMSENVKNVPLIVCDRHTKCGKRDTLKNFQKRTFQGFISEILRVVGLLGENFTFFNSLGTTKISRSLKRSVYIDVVLLINIPEQFESCFYFNPIRPGGGLRGPDGQTHSCQSETSYPMMPKLGDF